MEVELRWIFQLVQSLDNFMALFGAKHKMYFSFLDLSGSVLKCKKIKYQLSEFCLIVSTGPAGRTNPIIDFIMETFKMLYWDDRQTDRQTWPQLGALQFHFVSFLY